MFRRQRCTTPPARPGSALGPAPRGRALGLRVLNRAQRPRRNYESEVQPASSRLLVPLATTASKVSTAAHAIRFLTFERVGRSQGIKQVTKKMPADQDLYDFGSQHYRKYPIQPSVSCYKRYVQEFHAEPDPGPGGYDTSYQRCPCFWGTEPGRLVRLLADSTDLAGAQVLDLGCGEGKNAAFLANLGCVVEAWDISAAALNNAKAAWPGTPVHWLQKDALSIFTELRKFDVVIAYGLYHCLSSDAIHPTILNIQRVTAPGGYNIAVCYNNRSHVNISLAHPGFHPTCLAHADYIRPYTAWRIIAASDENLTERHPTNLIQHTHSMTRILAQNRNPS